MKNRSFAPALSVLAAALFATCSSSKASAAGPSSIWAKDDGSARVEIKKCGRGLCSEVVWLRNPKDSQGKPLHDARNENPSLRDRPIIGLPLFSNMRLTEPNTTGVQAEAPAPAPSFVKSMPKPIVREAQEQWPWLQRRSVLLASSRTGG